MARLKDFYIDEIVPAMMEKFQYGNTMEVPKLDKVVVNMVSATQRRIEVPRGGGGGSYHHNRAKPIITEARKSVSNFKLREGMKIGTKVTLRGDRMYEFVDKLLNVALPRVRDFRAYPTEPSMAAGTIHLA